MKKLLLVVTIGLLLAPTIASAATELITPTFITVDSVSGTVSDISIQGTYNGTDPASIRKTYMTFDLSSLDNPETITDAVFSITVSETGQYYMNSQDPLAILSDVDYEITVGDEFNWDSQPTGLISTQFGESVNLVSTDVAEWDLIDNGWDWETALTNGYVTLLLAPESIDFNNSALLNNAVLSIDYTIVPEPATIALLAMGLSGIATGRKKRN